MGCEEVPHFASVFLFQDREYRLLSSPVDVRAQVGSLRPVDTRGWEGGFWWAGHSGPENPGLRSTALSAPQPREAFSQDSLMSRGGDIPHPTPAWNPGAGKQAPQAQPL